ncbi:hypothetical protein KAR91_66695 [Candidatus Pacearchaeota archaeon]|nr:hypothetical protein [Candidatus Pacearchaeota archaeon]
MKYKIPIASEMLCESKTSGVTIAENRVPTIVADIKERVSVGKTWLGVNCVSAIEAKRLSEIFRDFGYIAYVPNTLLNNIDLVIDWSPVSQPSSGCPGLWAKFKKYFTG